MKQPERSRKEIFRRYIVFTLGLFFISLGVSLITRSLVGTSPISSIPYVFSRNFDLSMGSFIFLLNIVLIIGQMLMLGRQGIKENKWGLILQLPVSVAFGAFVDLTMAMLSFWDPVHYWMTLISLSLGCLSMGLGVSLEVTANVAMVSGEYFVQVASQRFKKEFGTVKLMFDISLVVIAVACSWILAGHIDGVREGTLAAAVVTGPLVRLIMPHLKWVERWECGGDSKSSDEDMASEAGHTVITIGREYGSGGLEIGKMLAQRLGIPFYDNSMMSMVAQETGIAEETVRALDQRLPHGRLFEIVTRDFSVPVERSMSTKDVLFVAQSRVIRRLASEGACVIVGRCSDYVLRDYTDCIHIFLHASPEYKEKRAIEFYGVTPALANRKVNEVNSARNAHYSYYTGKRWGDINSYDAVFDTSKLSPESVCDAIEILYRAKTAAPKD
jgi:uncharacterized membrane protein YczE/cytidylate kinase